MYCVGMGGFSSSVHVLPSVHMVLYGYPHLLGWSASLRSPSLNFVFIHTPNKLSAVFENVLYYTVGISVLSFPCLSTFQTLDLY